MFHVKPQGRVGSSTLSGPFWYLIGLMPDTSDAHMIAADKTEDTARGGRGGNKFLAWVWGIGAAIFGWLAVPRDYRNFTWDDLFGLGAVFALVTGVLAYCLAWKFSGRKPKEQAEQNGNQLYRIVTVVLPVIFLLLAVATLFLTLATFNGDWIEARQGLFTVFAALIAAAGAFVSVVVSYQISEENRKLQRELETKKQDAELIKTLNDRLHDILERRYSEDVDQKCASYFQLATLYKDWEALSESSALVENQKNNQQNGILRALFGVYLERSDLRSEQEQRVLNLVIKDIFPIYDNSELEEWDPDNIPECLGCSIDVSRDLSYLDLRELNLSNVCLNGSNLDFANLEGAVLSGSHMKGADLRGVRFGFEGDLQGLEHVWLYGIHLQEAKLNNAYLKKAILKYSNLKGAILDNANMQGADLYKSCLNNASLSYSRLEKSSAQKVRFKNTNLDNTYFNEASLQNSYFNDAVMYGTRLNYAHIDGCDLTGADMEYAHIEHVPLIRDSSSSSQKRYNFINQFKVAKTLPNDLHIWVGRSKFLEHIKGAHKKYWEEKKKSQ